MNKRKFYVVWNGRAIGVFQDWASCEQQVKGYPGAKYKSFDRLQDAEEAFYNDYEKYLEPKEKKVLSDEEKKQYGDPIRDSICVDASWTGNNGKMEYRGVEFKTGKQVFINGPFEQATNNIGEFLAIVHALAWMKENKDIRPIYSDSITAMAWIRRKQAKSKKIETDASDPMSRLILRAEAWLKNNTYENKILKWETVAWGENPADFGRK